MENFNNLGISKEILSNLKYLKLKKPTPVQQKAIKPGFEGKDILAVANTGTGKTAAFGIPIIQRLLKNQSMSAIILTPTRELAVQIGKHFNDLMGNNITIKCAILIGGDSIRKQIQIIKQKPRIFIGTPGRINDHVARKTINLKNINILVLDETDRMLDLGFIGQIQQIMKYLPDKRQTLLFTATLPKNIKNISEKYLFKPVKISVEKKENILANIEHNIINIKKVDKYQKLLEELNFRQGSVLIFMKTKHSSKKIYLKLLKDGMSVNAIHGNVRQNKRLNILNKFRNQKFRILVATDVAARGLDIAHIEHVINYDLPQKTEDYIHRIGRTARAGKKGAALSFISENDKKIWKQICKLISIKTNSEEKFPFTKKKNNGFSLKREDTQNNKNLQKKHSRFKNSDLNFKKKNNSKKLKKKNIRIDIKNNFDEKGQFKTKNKEFASKKKDIKNIKSLKKKIRSKDTNLNFKTKNKKKSKNLNKKMPSKKRNRVVRN